ncbi:MAG: hypothetical protein WBE76_16765 [Terracidiphilus sp.]
MNDLITAMSDANTCSQQTEAAGRPGLVFLDDRHRERRQNNRIESLVRSWPIVAGIVLACFAPMLKELLVVFKPWGMWVVFPFVALSARPELHLGGLGETVSQAMLFLQFPVEGYFAKKILKGRVTLSGVTGQILLYHFLGVAQLFLVCRALGDGTLH